MIKMLKKIAVFTLAVSLLPVFSMPVPAAQVNQGNPYSVLEKTVQEQGSDAEYDGYIFKLKDSVSGTKMNALSEEADKEGGVDRIEYTKNTFKADSVSDIKSFTETDNIEYIEPDYTVKLNDAKVSSASEPNDKYYSSKQWNLSLMNVPSVWEYGVEGQDLDESTDMDYDGKTGNDKVVVAVIDSGLKTGHEDIDWNRVIPGKNFIDTTSSTTDDTLGHGTFVSGMIMAQKDNDTGIAGILQNVSVMPLKVFEDEETDDSVIVNALAYATDQKNEFVSSKGQAGTDISVINMSLGSSSDSTALRTACENAMAAGIIVVCAAGNDGNTTASYPAQYSLGIGSTNSSSAVSSYSQRLSSSNGSGYENKVWVMAPGEEVTSLYCASTSSYMTGSGTSFSSPEVAALAAIAKSLDNNMTQEGFKDLLKKTATAKTGSSGNINGQDVDYGWGLVDFKQTVDELVGNQSGDASVTLSVKNEAGSAIANAHCAIYPVISEAGKDAKGSEVSPNSDGTYTLSKGKRYYYTAFANKYDYQEGTFAVLTSERTVVVTLKGKTYATSFSVKNTRGDVVTDPDIKVYTSTGAAVSQNSDGTFGTRNGTYTYSASGTGYFPATGSFTVDDTKDSSLDSGKTVSVVIRGDIDVCSLKTKVLNESGDDISSSATLSFKDSDGQTVSAYTDGQFKLAPGTYTYTAFCEDYTSETGKITVTDADKAERKLICIDMDKPIYTVFFDVMPLTASATVTITDVCGKQQIPVSDERYAMVNGTYYYNVSCPGYNTYTGSFTVSGARKYVEVQMESGKDTVWDGTADLSKTAGIVLNNKKIALDDLKKYAESGTYTQKKNGVSYAHTCTGISLSTLVSAFGGTEKTADGISFETADGTVSYSADEVKKGMLAWNVDNVAVTTGTGVQAVLNNGSTGQWVSVPISASVDYHTHIYTGTVTKVATDSEKGEITWTCSCGDTFKEELPATGSGSDEPEADTVFITIDGQQIGLSKLKRYASTVKYKMESYDGSTESFSCEGILLQDLVSHFVDDAKCVTAVYATAVDDYAVDYDLSDIKDGMLAWSVDGEAGSEENGLRIVVDGDSGKWLYAPEVFAVTAGKHTYADTVTKPTCTEQGYTTHVCSACGKTYVDSYVPALGHKYEKTVVPPTCTEEGYTIYTCSVCGHTYVDDYVPKAGHDYKLTEKKAPTAVLDGYELYVCTKCKDSYKKVIPATGLSAPAVTASVVSSAGTVRLSWLKLAGATSYAVYRSDMSDGTYKLLKTVTSLTFADITGAVGKTWYYKVVGRCGNGNADKNSILSAPVKGVRKLPAVTAKLAISSGKPKISWKKVSAASGYAIYRASKQGGSYKKIKTVSAASYRDKSAVKGKTYYYKIQALYNANRNANSAFSNIVKGRARK